MKQLIQMKHIDTFLQHLQIPTFSLEKQINLDKEIIVEEVEWAIDKLKINKTPGPDGFPTEFYKIYKKELKPYLLELFKHCTEQGSMLDSWHKAKELLIGKPDKNLKKWSNHIDQYPWLTTIIKYWQILLQNSFNPCYLRWFIQINEGLLGTGI